MANAAETKVKEKDGVEAVYNKESIILEAIGDPDAQRMGPAKDGGEWYKNSAGTCYRVDKDDKGGYEVKETKQATITTKKKASGPSRAEMMQKAKEKKIKYFRILSKAELSEALKEDTTEAMIKELQAVAIKRWHDGGSKTA
jgi:hypothetical protein